MATKKAAESTLYHLSPKGFWKKFRDVVVVNPEISTGLPLAAVHRRPQPASRPELYTTPATKASDPAQNPYWKRDVRRTYPQLSVITQSELASLLIEHSSAKSVSAPATEDAKTDGTTTTAAATTTDTTQDLSSAISLVTAEQQVYSPSRLPPRPPIAYKPWVPELAPAAPHPEHSYFPMLLYK